MKSAQGVLYSTQGEVSRWRTTEDNKATRTGNNLPDTGNSPPDTANSREDTASNQEGTANSRPTGSLWPWTHSSSFCGVSSRSESGFGRGPQARTLSTV